MEPHIEIKKVELDLKRSGVGVPYHPTCIRLGLVLASVDGSRIGCAPPSIPATHHPGVLDLVQQLVTR